MPTMNDIKSNVEFAPYVTKGIHSKWVENAEPINLSKEKSDAFIVFLNGSPWVDAINKEFDLQDLCQRVDGTRLLSAMVPAERFIEMMLQAGETFAPIVTQANKWHKTTEFNKMVIHFEAKNQKDSFF